MKQPGIHRTLWAFVLLALTAPGFAWAVEPLVIEEGVDRYFLGTHLEYFEDKEGSLKIADVLKPEMSSWFVPSLDKIPNLGYTKSAYWFSLQLRHDKSKTLNKFLVIPFPILDDVQFYLSSPVRLSSRINLGDHLPHFARPIDHRNFVIPIEVKPGELLRIDVRVETHGDAMQLPLILWSAQRFLEQDSTDTMIQGLFFGLILVMALYNLFVFFSIKERAYLFYVLFVVSFAAWQAAFNGLSYQYLWPSYPWWAEKSLLLFLSLTVVFGVLFAQEFLGLRQYAHKSWRFLGGIVALASAGALSAFFLPYAIVALVLVVLGTIGCVFLLVLGFLRWREGSLEAFYYSLAWASLLVGAILLSFTTMGLIPANNLTTHGVQIGAALMVVVLSLGLARKMKTLQEENFRIQKEAADILQQKVDERTRDLSLKNLEAQEATQQALSAKSEAEVAKSESDKLRADAEEHAVELEELDKQKTAFFQNISHELRTPLTLILNPLESAALDHVGDKNIDVATKNSRRLLRLVNQLLDFQKLSAGKREIDLTPINMVRFVHICGDYFASACSTKEISFNVTLNGQQMSHQDALEKTIFVNGEIDSLEKIAFNFLSNALKYTPQGGTIELGLSEDEDHARILIRDSGPGISDEGKQKLFHVFSQVDGSATREYEGTGLGLALAKDLAEALSGKVGIDSEVGQGSTFWAELPIIENPEDVLDFLLVEDDEPVLQIMADFVPQAKNIGRFKLARNAEEARTILASHQVKVLASDENMEGETGVELMQYVAETQPDCRRIIVTGGGNEEGIRVAINDEIVHRVFYKPIVMRELIACVESMVKASPIVGMAREGIEDFRVKDWLLADSQGQTGQESDDSAESLVDDSDGGGELVLVVDDLQDMRDLIGNSLKKKNYRVVTAPNGKRGVEIAREMKPNLIITDWMMPLMTGPDLIREIKEGRNALSSIPIILLTAKSDEESKLIGTEIGADAFLGKPFNYQELGSMVRNLLSLKTREKEVDDLNKMLTESVLKRYLPPDLVDQIVSGETSLEQAPKSMPVTILFSDLVDFTSLTNKLRAGRMARVLNQYLIRMTRIIYSHGGTIDKFIGDAIMVIFGAPIETTPALQTQQASECALAMHEALDELNKEWMEEGMKAIEMRIGLHHGPVVVGTFGGEERSDYTAIGTTVNVAARIQSACVPGDVFVSGEFYDYIHESLAEDAGTFDLKGLGEINLYKLLGSQPS